jgi:hypothetical protein
VHGLDPDEFAQLVERRGGGHVTDVQGDRRLLEHADAFPRQRPTTAREVRIAEERDQNRPSTKRPSR